MFVMCILKSEKPDRYYIGHTSELEDRLQRHKEGRSKSTKAGAPWVVVYTEQFATKSEAYQRQIQIKNKKSSVFIDRLICT